MGCFPLTHSWMPWYSTFLTVGISSIVGEVVWKCRKCGQKKMRSYHGNWNDNNDGWRSKFYEEAEHNRKTIN